MFKWIGNAFSTVWGGVQRGFTWGWEQVEKFPALATGLFATLFPGQAPPGGVGGVGGRAPPGTIGGFSIITLAIVGLGAFLLLRK